MSGRKEQQRYSRFATVQNMFFSGSSIYLCVRLFVFIGSGIIGIPPDSFSTFSLLCKRMYFSAQLKCRDCSSVDPKTQTVLKCSNKSDIGYALPLVHTL